MPYLNRLFQVISLILLLSSSLFSQDLNTEYTDTLKSLINQGYPFAFITKEAQVVKIEKGPLYYFAGFITEPNFKTDSIVFLKLSGLKRDQIWNQSDIELRLNQLLSIGYFERINSEITEEYFKHQSRQLLYIDPHLVDKKINSIEGLYAYSNEDKPSGFFNLNLFNINGTARDLNLYLEQANKSNTIYFKYTEPWLLNFPIQSELELMHYQDLNQQEQSAGIILMATKNEYIRPQIGYQISLLADSTQKATKWNQYLIGIELGYSPILDLEQKQNLFKYQLKLHQIKNFISQHSLSNKLMIPLFKNLSSLTEYQFKITWPYSDFSPNFIYKLGGHQILRGYAPQSFFTKWYHFISQDFLFKVNPAIQPGFFFDQAYFENYLFEKHYKLSGGFLLNFISSQKSWQGQISYGIPYDQEFLLGWLHLKIKHFF